MNNFVYFCIFYKSMLISKDCLPLYTSSFSLFLPISQWLFATLHVILQFIFANFTMVVCHSTSHPSVYFCQFHNGCLPLYTSSFSLFLPISQWLFATLHVILQFIFANFTMVVCHSTRHPSVYFCQFHKDCLPLYTSSFSLFLPISQWLFLTFVKLRLFL